MPGQRNHERGHRRDPGATLPRRAALALALALFAPEGAEASDDGARAPLDRELRALRLAVEDLVATFGPRYGRGRDYLDRLGELERAHRAGDSPDRGSLRQLRREALLDSPLVRGQRILLVRRRPRTGRGGGPGRDIGLPSNHEANSSLERLGHDNEIAILSASGEDDRLRPLFRPPDGGYVGEIDLHWDGERLLFTRSDRRSWRIWEIRVDGTGLRQVSTMPDDVDCSDACYLPDGRIIFGSTASYQSVPCWHGQRRVNHLYIMNADGSGVRQLCFDQDHDFHPCVLPNGQVLYHRWDYTGPSHIFLRELMVMNPDGTGQRAVYGSNSWFPNSLYFPRPLPGAPGRLVCILSGYHGVHRMGQLVLVDTGRGWYEAEGLVTRISGRGDPVRPAVRDNLVDGDWPRFLHPFPLSDRNFLVAAWPRRDAPWGIYLADVFDNVVLVHEERGYALLEPILLAPSPRPPALPDRVEPGRTDATVYIHDIHAGPGLEGVPRGTVPRLRVLAYHFGYRGLAGSDKIGRGGPWDAMRILGTVPVEADGSAHFRVPASTPLAVQPLDADGHAIQLMRSWFTAMPGEAVSCVGCHESPATPGPVRRATAGLLPPREITPWHGPPRGFDFGREVQPVLDRRCVSCHDGSEPSAPDLRSEEAGGRARSWPIGYASRLHPDMRRDTGGRMRYTPAYDILVERIRRVGIEDDVSLLNPGEYHVDTSELVQMLRKGHHGVDLDTEEWDRLTTWIDLNAPCHGTWNDVYPIPDGAHERRMELRALYGGPADDPERIPPVSPPPRATAATTPRSPSTTGRPPRPASATPAGALPARPTEPRQPLDDGPRERTIDLGGGLGMRLVRIPAGEFIPGDPEGCPDEAPAGRVTIPAPFWMGVNEVTNEQLRRFDPGHRSGYYVKRHARADDRGLSLDGPRQPAVRVSWRTAQGFCRWLSGSTGLAVSLPTEAQWEYACRAGTRSALWYGSVDDDFSAAANLADASFSTGLMKARGDAYPPGVTQITGGVPHLLLEGAALSDARFDDGAVVTAPVGSFLPNPWGLHDMHGNAAEWTLSTYRPRSGSQGSPLDSGASETRKAVRGGSFFDRPWRGRSAFRLAFPPWRRIFNVGFRVVAVAPE